MGGIDSKIQEHFSVDEIHIDENPPRKIRIYKCRKCNQTFYNTKENDMFERNLLKEHTPCRLLTVEQIEIDNRWNEWTHLFGNLRICMKCARCFSNDVSHENKKRHMNYYCYLSQPNSLLLRAVKHKIVNIPIRYDGYVYESELLKIVENYERYISSIKKQEEDVVASAPPPYE